MAIYSTISAPTVTTETDCFAPKFSLVLATVGRTAELARFLKHLDAQTYREFELILVDQNPGNDLDALVHEYQDRFPIMHLRSMPGLSYARNVGLRHVSGHIIAFPDDDCWYACDTLEQVAEVLRTHPEYDGLSGMAVDESRTGSFPSFPRNGGWVTKNNVWRCALSITIFLRSALVRHVGGFDEDLGVGSRSGRLSGEETDYLIRALESGFRIYYRPDLDIFHPYPHFRYDHTLAKRGYNYSLGFGYVIRKHRYSPLFIGYYWMRALTAAALSFLTFEFGKSRYYWAVLRGRVIGWLG